MAVDSFTHIMKLDTGESIPASPVTSDLVLDENKSLYLIQNGTPQKVILAEDIRAKLSRLYVTSAALTIPHNTATDITWGAWGASSMYFWDPTGDTTKLQMLEDGWYMVSVVVTFAENSNGIRKVSLKTDHNSTITEFPLVQLTANPSGVWTGAATYIPYFFANDTLTISVMQTSGGDLDIPVDQTWLFVRQFGEL